MVNRRQFVNARMALAMGIFLPAAETVRRIHQVLEFREFFSWFDDYLLGAVLVAAAISVFRARRNSGIHLVAAWGISSGALFMSFLGQFRFLQAGAGEPGIFSGTFVAVVKALILLYMLTGLTISVKANSTG